MSLAHFIYVLSFLSCFSLAEELIGVSEDRPEPWIAMAHSSSVANKKTRAIYFAQKVSNSIFKVYSIFNEFTSFTFYLHVVGTWRKAQNTLEFKGMGLKFTTFEGGGGGGEEACFYNCNDLQ